LGKKAKKINTGHIDFKFQIEKFQFFNDTHGPKTYQNSDEIETRGPVVRF